MKSKIYFLVASVFVFFFFISCSVQRVSKIVQHDIKSGMTKEQVVSLLGKPYKVAMASEKDVTYDQLYYKEDIWTGRTYVLTESILSFKNNVLVKIDQGQERMEGDTTIINK
ncbi:outer membrane protein assembly factor BamE domain-containing protein [Elizabethkingia meningoseptica]|uniref:outer membrane protein assembly factor BamE domain-containing protein n=1 Tax=Elizabethkingia meningoseptica TaxID=238 RepID=UPI003015FF7C